MTRLSIDLDVVLSEDAKAFVLSHRVGNGIESPGLVIHRKGPIGDNKRAGGGTTEWQVERPEHPWRIEIKQFPQHRSDPAFTKEVNAVPVQLLFIPKAEENQLTITLREGQLHVQESSHRADS
jgi:hypothetical protein